MQEMIYPIIIAAISNFLLGGIWYAKPIFGNIWCQEARITCSEKGHTARVFIMAFILAVIAAWAFNYLLPQNASLKTIFIYSAVIGAGFVATSFGTNYAFAGRSFKLFLIDAGYHFYQFMIYGLVFGLWLHFA